MTVSVCSRTSYHHPREVVSIKDNFPRHWRVRRPGCSAAIHRKLCQKMCVPAASSSPRDARSVKRPFVCFAVYLALPSLQLVFGFILVAVPAHGSEFVQQLPLLRAVTKVTLPTCLLQISRQTTFSACYEAATICLLA